MFQTFCGEQNNFVFGFQQIAGHFRQLFFVTKQFAGHKSKSCLVANGLFETEGGVEGFEKDLY